MRSFRLLPAQITFKDARLHERNRTELNVQMRGRQSNLMRACSHRRQIEGIGSLLVPNREGCFRCASSFWLVSPRRERRSWTKRCTLLFITGAIPTVKVRSQVLSSNWGRAVQREASRGVFCYGMWDNLGLFDRVLSLSRSHSRTEGLLPRIVKTGLR